MLIEACVENFAEALRAEAAGAGRIELCAELDRDGLTPGRELIAMTCHRLQIPVKVMIRPHDRGFIYTEPELRAMEEEILFCRKAGAWGVVFGMTGKDSHLDPLAIGRLAAAAIGMNVTVHRVIDRTGDPLAELASLLRIKGVGSVLSSGGRATAEEGAGILQQMVQLAGERIEVIAAGKITPENLHRLHGMIQAPAYHGRKIV